MPHLIDQDAFLSGQRIAVLECSLLSATVSILAPLGARASQDRAHPTYSVNPAPPGSADIHVVDGAHTGCQSRTPWERARLARMQPCRGRFGTRASRPHTQASTPPGCADVSPACSLSGAGFSGSPGIPARVLGIKTPRTPPAPLVGEGGRGDEGQKARECRKPRIAPKNSTLESPAPPA